MRYAFSITVLAIALLWLSNGTALAQLQKGNSTLGARVGFGILGGTTFGADYEYVIANPGELGPGIVGIGGSIDYWGWSDGSGTDYFSYSDIPIGVMAYYHLNLSNSKWDLFGGIGLGYDIVSATWHGDPFLQSFSSSYVSEVYEVVQAGARYFFSPNLAAQARIGFGVSWLSLGVDYKL